MIANPAQPIHNKLRLLQAAEPTTGRVLTAYLDTAPGRVAENAPLVAFRDACTRLRASLAPGETAAFEQATRQAEAHLASEYSPGRPGLALFASGADDYFFALPLPRRPADEAAWGERPLLGPLEEMLADCERTAVVLFDKEQAHIFSVFLDEIEERRDIHDEVPGKQATGGWFGLAQTRYARHHEDHVLRHARHAIHELLSMSQERPFDHLLIAGPDEALANFRQQLPRTLRTRLAGTLHVELFAPEAAVLQATLKETEQLRQRTEQAEVGELLEAATTPHVVLGLRATLGALNDRRVHRLFVAEGLSGQAGECPNCQLLIAGPGDCPACGAPTRSIGDLRERLLDLARQQGARIEFVSGQAAALLAAYDWLGAWTRY